MGAKPAKGKPAKGRPSLYSPKVGGRIIERILAGVSFEAAANSCGVLRSTLWNWIKLGQRALREAGDELARPIPDSLHGWDPPDLATFSEAIQFARGEARALHEANFARHARVDWRASYAWLRHRATKAWGDSPENDDEAPPRKRPKLEPVTSLGTDLTTEIDAARARLGALREIIARGGTGALPLDRALTLEAITMGAIGRLVKAQFEVNPGAGKAGDFRISIDLTEGAAAVDLGPRVPNLEAGNGGKSARKPIETEAKRKPMVDGSGWDEP
jgi:hypothetical protein